MSRPSIRDLAEKAGVSVATVNRVLAGKTGVRAATRESVESAAAEIGFYGLGAIHNRNLASRPNTVSGYCSCSRIVPSNR